MLHFKVDTTLRRLESEGFSGLKPGNLPADIVIPGNCIASARLIVSECGAVMEGCAKMIERAGDWRAPVTASMLRDHIRKLEWVHSWMCEAEANDRSSATLGGSV